MDAKILVVCLCFAVNVHAQNWAVKFLGPNLDGRPTNLFERVSVGTNTTVPPGYDLVTNQVGITALSQAALSAYATYQSNRIFLIESNRTANIAAIVVLFGQVDNGLVLTTNLFTSITNVENSLASGTNSLAQVVTRIRQVNSAVNDQNLLINRILLLFERLKPVLREIYDGKQ